MNLPVSERCQAEHLDLAALARRLNITLREQLGRHAWRGHKPSGAAVVLLTGARAENSIHDLLNTLPKLHPPFAFPRIIAAEPGFFLIYSFIDGAPLSSRDFEAEESLAAAFELSGRLTALFRSLNLASMFQGLVEGSELPQNTPSGAAQRLAFLGSRLDQQSDSLAIRRQEASLSYSWARQLPSWCASRWLAADTCPTGLWSALQARVEAVTSIHLPPQGSNLAHTNFTPKHLLVCPPDRWGIVGWQVASRPYNYMRYKYLAWCLVHTEQANIIDRYRRFLALMPAIQYSAAASLTFALCLLETWVEASEPLHHRSEKLAALYAFVEEGMTAIPLHSNVPYT
ncbi:hypothetical protein [Desulfobacca acetoxidans]